MMHIVRSKIGPLMAVVVLGAACGPGCTLLVGDYRTAVSTPDYSFAYSIDDKYFCSGDLVHLTWETEDVDQFKIIRGSGSAIFTATAANGSADILMTADMLPLKVKVTDSGGDTDTYIVPPEDLVNVDEPSWTTPIPSTREAFREPDAYELVEVTPPGSDVREYEVYVHFRGYRWYQANPNVYPADAIPGPTLPFFTESVRIRTIQNLADERLVFSANTFQAVRLDPDAQGHVAEYPQANIGFLSGFYQGNQTRRERWGYQWGEYQKDPPDPDYRQEITYEPRVVNMKLEVFCQE